METRDKFIQTTSELLETQGYHATGLKQIITESGAPRGSLYYHFPGGKEELAAEAVKANGETFARLIRENMREDIPPAESVHQFVMGVAGGVESTHFNAGGPLTAVAIESANTSELLNQVCQSAYTQIQEAIAAKLRATGVHSDQAPSLAGFIVAAIEGGVILSRTRHTIQPLKDVADRLLQFLSGTPLGIPIKDLSEETTS